MRLRPHPASRGCLLEVRRPAGCKGTGERRAHGSLQGGVRERLDEDGHGLECVEGGGTGVDGDAHDRDVGSPEAQLDHKSERLWRAWLEHDRVNAGGEVRIDPGSGGDDLVPFQSEHGGEETAYRVVGFE